MCIRRSSRVTVTGALIYLVILSIGTCIVFIWQVEMGVWLPTTGTFERRGGDADELIFVTKKQKRDHPNNMYRRQDVTRDPRITFTDNSHSIHDVQEEVDDRSVKGVGVVDDTILQHDQHSSNSWSISEDLRRIVDQELPRIRQEWAEIQKKNENRLDNGKWKDNIVSIFGHDESFLHHHHHHVFEDVATVSDNRLRESLQGSKFDDLALHTVFGLDTNMQNETCTKWIIYSPLDEDFVWDSFPCIDTQASDPDPDPDPLWSSRSEKKGWCTLVVLAKEPKEMQPTSQKNNCPNTYVKSFSPAEYHVQMEQIQNEHVKKLMKILLNNIPNKTEEQHGANRTVLSTASSSMVLARKNFGYLVALLHGAEYILEMGMNHEFQSRKMGNENHTSAPVFLDSLHSMMPLNVSVVIQGRKHFNPIPLLLNPQNHYDDDDDDASIMSWPRGFPGLMEPLHQKYFKGKIAFHKNMTLASKRIKAEASGRSNNIYQIGVVQFVPDGYPDMDLFLFAQQHREQQPMKFHPSHSLMVPSHSYAPYNMHSTLFTYDALWSLLLPTSLPQRHADVLRSYFAQCLFPDLGLRVVYMPSIVQHQKNRFVPSSATASSASKIKRDLLNDLELMVQLESLISFLGQWDSPYQTLPVRMEHLWKDLYVRKYVSRQDVELLQSWLSFLNIIGYKFPKLKKRRFHNVAVMGHFNYAQSPSQVDDVVFWTQKYKEWFETVIVTGPFQNEQIEELKKHDIKAFGGERNEEGGYFQVTENLKNTLLYFKNWSKIESVMYFHDDGLINVTELSKGIYPFPSHEIIGNYRDQRYDLSYADVRKIEDVELANKFSYRIYPNGTVCSFDKTLCQPTVKDLYRTLPLYQWGMTTKGYCGASQQQLAQDADIFPYHDTDGSILFSSFTQSDFLHIPTKYADDFNNLASLFLKHNVIHECSWGTIVDMIRRQYNASVRLTMLCTSWGPKRRGKKALIQRCLKDRVDYGVFHPYKIGYEENGYQGYDWVLDVVQ